MPTNGDGIDLADSFNQSSGEEDGLLRKSGQYAIRMTAKIDSYDIGTVDVVAEQVILDAENRSKAVCSVQFLSRFEEYPAVSCMEGGPADKIKGGSRVSIKIQGAGETPVMLGSVVGDKHQLDSDSYVIEIEDDKWLLAGVYIYGKFTYDADAQEEIFINGEPCIFNENGKPNCLITSKGPLFSPFPYYGWVLGEELKSDDSSNAKQPTFSPEYSNDEASDWLAKFWTISDVMEYLRNHYTTKESPATNIAAFHFIPVDIIDWPVGLSNALLVQDEMSSDDVSGIKEGDTVGQNKSGIKHLDFQGVDLESAIMMLCKMSGSYSLYMKPKANGQSQMCIVPTKYSSGMLTNNTKFNSVHRLTGSGSSEIKGRQHIITGSVERDFRKSYTNVMVLGDRVWEDCRFEFDPSSASPNMENESDWLLQQLQPAYSKSVLEAFRCMIAGKNNPDEKGSKVSYPYPNTVQAFRDAVHLFPMALSGYRIIPKPEGCTADAPVIGTQYKDFPFLNVPCKTMPNLLSWSAEVGKGTTRRFLQIPAFVEIKIFTGWEGGTEDGEVVWGAWMPVTELNGLEIDDQGTIYLPGLREAGLYNNQNSTWIGSIYDPLGTGEWLGPLGLIRLRPIRITIPVALDYRVHATRSLNTGERYFKLGADPLKEVFTCDPAGENDSFDVLLNRQYVFDAGTSYKRWIRKAEPWPTSIDFDYITTSDGSGDTAGGGKQTTTIDPVKAIFGIDKSKFKAGTILDEQLLAHTHAGRRLADLGRPSRTSDFVFPSFVINHPGTAMDYLITSGTKESKWKLYGVVKKVNYNYRDQTTTIDLG